MSFLTEGPYGFAWGPLEVRRVTDHRGYHVLQINTDAGKSVNIYVSPTGRSVRIFKEGKEML